MLKGIKKVGIKFRREREAKNNMDVRKEWQILSHEFKRYETLQGKQSVRKIPYELKPFFVYLDTHSLELEELNYKLAQEYQTYLTTLENPDGSIHYSANAVSGMMYTVKVFYEFLKTKGIAHTNPFKSIRYIKRKNKIPKNIPKEDKMDKFLESLRCFWEKKHLWHKRNLYKVHVIAELMYATGLRLQEVADLEVEDIDVLSKIVLVRKGKGGERKAYLNEYAAQVLQYYINEMREYVNKNRESTKLFGVKSGKAMEEMLNGWLKKMGEAAGIKRFTSHSFRHTLGFHLLRRGCGLRYIQLILGHKDMRSTTIYAKVEKEDLRNELDTYHPRKFRTREKQE